MKKLHILALAITAVLASSFAVAQTATPATGVKAAPRITPCVCGSPRCR